MPGLIMILCPAKLRLHIHSLIGLQIIIAKLTHRVVQTYFLSPVLHTNNQTTKQPNNQTTKQPNNQTNKQTNKQR